MAVNQTVSLAKQLREHVELTCPSLKRGPRISGFLSTVALLGSLRVLRSWNQTGQKHAGEPDIAKNILPTHNFMLWALVLGTYVDVAQRMSRKLLPGVARPIAISCAITLCLAALGFKITFTKADSPELLLGLQALVLRPMEESSLEAQATAVFFGIALLVCLTISPYASKSSRVKENSKSTICLLLIQV